MAPALDNISKLYTTMGKADDAKKLADRAAEIRALSDKENATKKLLRSGKSLIAQTRCWNYSQRE